MCGEVCACLYIYEVLVQTLICHSLVNVQRGVSVDVCCHHPLRPHLSVFQHSFSSTTLPPSLLFYSSSPLPPSTLPPALLFPAPHAGANFRAPSSPGSRHPAGCVSPPLSSCGASLVDVLHRALRRSSRAWKRCAVGVGGGQVSSEPDAL